MLTTRALNRATLHRQWLVERADASAAEAVEHLVGMQAQEPFSAYYGLWSRLNGFKAAELADLLTGRGAVRVPLYRATIHLVTAADHARIQPLFREMLRKRFLSSPYGGGAKGMDLDELEAVALPLLAERPRTRRELCDLLAAHWPDRDPESLGSAVAQITPVVQVPPRGVWGQNGPAAWAPADRWLGERPAANGTAQQSDERPAENDTEQQSGDRPAANDTPQQPAGDHTEQQPSDRPAANDTPQQSGGRPAGNDTEQRVGERQETPGLADLVRRYLAAFGPATVKDIQTWCGLTRLRQVTADMDLRVLTDDAGRELLDLPDAPLPDETTPVPVRFLPEFDNLLLAHHDRTRVISQEDYRRGIVIGGKPTLLVDGFVHGIWRVGDGALEVEVFRPLTRAQRADVLAEGTRLLEFAEVDGPVRLSGP